MPERAGAKGSVTGTTACLPGPAVQHDLGASARDSNKWLPGAWRALSCSPALLLCSLLASLLRVRQSFPPECLACPIGAPGKKHSDRSEYCGLVQSGTKMQTELSSYSKATHTSVSKYQLQQHTAFPSSYCHRSYNPTPRQTKLSPGLCTPPGSSTFSWMSLNIPWDTDQRKGTSPSAPHFTQLSGLADFCWYPQHSSRKPLQCHALTPTAAAFIAAWGLSSSDPPSAPLCDLSTPLHGLARGQAPPPPISITPSVQVLAFFSAQLMHQGHSRSAPDPRVFHPSDPLTKGSPRGSEPVTKQSFEHNAPWDHSFFLPPPPPIHRERTGS